MSTGLSRWKIASSKSRNLGIRSKTAERSPATERIQPAQTAGLYYNTLYIERERVHQMLRLCRVMSGSGRSRRSSRTSLEGLRKRSNPKLRVKFIDVQDDVAFSRVENTLPRARQTFWGRWGSAVRHEAPAPFDSMSWRAAAKVVHAKGSS